MMDDTDGGGRSNHEPKSRGAKRKPKGRFSSANASRPHHPRNIVFERVDDENTSTEKFQTESPKSAPSADHRSKRMQSHPNRRPNSRRYADNPTERNWREREPDMTPSNDTVYPRPDFVSSRSRGQRGRPNRKRFDDVKTLHAPDDKPNTDIPSQQDEPDLPEEAMLAAASSSLNVEARPFVPQSIKAPSSKHMTKLGQVKHVRGKRSGKIPSQQEVGNNNEAAARCKEPGGEDQVRPKSKQSVSAADSQQPRSQPNRSKDAGGSNKSHRYSLKNEDRQQQRREADNSENMSNASSSSSAAPSDKKSTNSKKGMKPKSAQHRALHSFVEKKPKNAVDIANLREHLIENLTNGSYECAICCSTVSQETAIWNCGKCYQLFHFDCIKKWGNTLIAQGEDNKGWRCPMCQEGYSTLPKQYRCFCSKRRDPECNNYDTPHSCGEVCGKKRADNCSHRCTELCHPGPCPPCHAYTSKHCNCGRSYQKVKCSQQVNVRCSQMCNRRLNCGKHSCTAVCHVGACKPCSEVIEQVCYCGVSRREITCGSDGIYSEVYSCLRECGKALSCGNHNCAHKCHAGNCPPCESSPEVVQTCNCGKVPLSALENCVPRAVCTDSIPSCENICGKELNCGKVISAGARFKHHRCQMRCHEGDCSCQLTSQIICKCGNKRDTVSCVVAMQYTAQNPYRCDKKCPKKRECGRHKCGQACCTLESHPCLQICGKRLTCGTHKCQELCHLGNCPTCYNVSFDDLHCHCGVTMMYPPIPCGTNPPSCPERCNRTHDCEHAVTHRCHSGDGCPPCTVLTTKLCMGGHEYRNNIPCWMKEISCGTACEKPLPCGDHKCPKTCHKGACGNQVCKQACPKLRETCKHPCGAECHLGQPCPSTDCHKRVLLRCDCGNRMESVLCYMKSKRLATSVLAIRMKELSCSLSIPELMASMEKDRLECDKECAKLERNQRIASALDICNPELLANLAGPQYTEFLKTMARKDPVFIAEIERSLSELVHSSQQSKHQTRSHAFKPMKKDQRQAIHELAEMYGCTSLSYDDEPLRNVVAMAQRGKCEMPSQTLTSFIKSEKHPRPPLPIPINANVSEIREKSRKDFLSTEVKPQENKIDYFEMTQ